MAEALRGHVYSAVTLIVSYTTLSVMVPNVSAQHSVGHSLRSNAGAETVYLLNRLGASNFIFTLSPIKTVSPYVCHVLSLEPEQTEYLVSCLNAVTHVASSWPSIYSSSVMPLHHFFSHDESLRRYFEASILFQSYLF